MSLDSGGLHAAESSGPSSISQRSDGPAADGARRQKRRIENGSDGRLRPAPSTLHQRLSFLYHLLIHS